MRWFNTAGPCREADHYMLAAMDRLPKARRLIARKSYFVVHAPRQTGKSTALIHLARELTASGEYAALYFSCESAEVAGDDVGWAENILLSALTLHAKIYLDEPLRPPDPSSLSGGHRLRALLSAWAQTCPRPIVLLMDEIDALRGKSLISVLRQLREGFTSRPAAFPQSVILCGLRDVRDYKAASGGDPERLGTSSPFNIKIASLKVRNFNAGEIDELYGQHTSDTGQAFTKAALEMAWHLTEGQPWLVNALAREVIDEMEIPETEAITCAHLDRAKERLILARATHLDSLVSKLLEPRVRRIIEPLIAGQMIGGDAFNEDLSYCRDLGLIAADNPVRVSNPIYREVIVRVLNGAAQAVVTADPRSYIDPDGRLNLERILNEFVAFWREHGGIMSTKLPYHEVAPQLIIMAYLQRVVNGGGYIDREYGVGRGRIDLLVRWPYLDEAGRSHVQRFAMELKVRTDRSGDPLQRGLKQLDEYLTTLNLDEGTLVIFDSRPGSPEPDERTQFEAAISPMGRPIRVLRA